MKKLSRLALTLGVGVALTIPTAMAMPGHDNPFKKGPGAHPPKPGMKAPRAHDGQCGAGKCGADMKKMPMDKAHEGGCGAGKCGAEMKKPMPAAEGPHQGKPQGKHHGKHHGNHPGKHHPKGPRGHGPKRGPQHHPKHDQG